MPAALRHSDICLSIRSLGGAFGSREQALALLAELRPTRVEWSYVRDAELIAQFKAVAPVFVAALNTIAPPGHAESFIGTPVIAPWMTRFGRPAARSTYICQNNPEDLASRSAQAVDLIAAGVTDSFQFDDWYGNAQMLDFGQPCFCPHCQREFAAELGLDLDYRRYLRGRGFTHTSEILEAAKRGEVPLWDDYRRFQGRTVTRFFRRLRAAMDQALAAPASLSVNGSVLNFGGSTETVLPFVSYFHGETWDFAPASLLKLAEASRTLGVKQIVSFFPDVPAADYHAPAFVGRVRQAIGLCYCLGVVPLFPYDVYAGNEPDGTLKPRWFGTWEEYRAPYETVRAHRDWFDGYRYTACEVAEDGTVTVCSAQAGDSHGRLRHRLAPDGAWEVEELAANRGP
jgi:hypothetical protein